MFCKHCKTNEAKSNKGKRAGLCQNCIWESLIVEKMVSYGRVSFSPLDIKKFLDDTPYIRGLFPNYKEG